MSKGLVFLIGGFAAGYLINKLVASRGQFVVYAGSPVVSGLSGDTEDIADLWDQVKNLFRSHGQRAPAWLRHRVLERPLDEMTGEQRQILIETLRSALHSFDQPLAGLACDCGLFGLSDLGGDFTVEEVLAKLKAEFDKRTDFQAAFRWPEIEAFVRAAFARGLIVSDTGPGLTYDDAGFPKDTFINRHPGWHSLFDAMTEKGLFIRKGKP